MGYEKATLRAGLGSASRQMLWDAGYMHCCMGATHGALLNVQQLVANARYALGIQRLRRSFLNPFRMGSQARGAAKRRLEKRMNILGKHVASNSIMQDTGHVYVDN